jgi:hypothetical protein
VLVLFIVRVREKRYAKTKNSRSIFHSQSESKRNAGDKEQNEDGWEGRRFLGYLGCVE